jgi:hypothetical protein
MFYDPNLFLDFKDTIVFIDIISLFYVALKLIRKIAELRGLNKDVLYFDVHFGLILIVRKQ